MSRDSGFWPLSDAVSRGIANRSLSLSAEVLIFVSWRVNPELTGTRSYQVAGSRRTYARQ